MHQDMENIKEQLEEVIKKKHNELFKIDYNMDYNTKLNLQRKILEDLADEVLKVIIMEIEKEDNKWNGNGEHYANVREALNNLLSNLSTNKENKRNTKESGIVDLATGQESDFCAYEVESKDDLCGKPQYKGGFCKRHYRKVYGDF